MLHCQRNDSLRKQSPDSIHHKQHDKLFPKTLDVEPCKSNVKHVKKSNQKLKYYEFDDDALLVVLMVCVALVFRSAAGYWPPELLVYKVENYGVD